MHFTERMAPLCLAMALGASATTISLSGTVTDSTTKMGLSGVKVSLAKDSLSAITASNGSWSLLHQDAADISSRNAVLSGASHLTAQDGHILLRYEGHDLLGHASPGISATVARTSSLARKSGLVADTIDTLLFSWKDTVRVRLPITNYVQSGLATTLDTTSISVVVVTGDSGTFTDTRDNQVYKYVKIGNQWWMAQNLNYKVDSSWCLDGIASNCATYGRLYQWAAAMGLDTGYNNKFWQGADSAQHQGICPSGWHVPSDAEWSKLTDTTLSSSTASTVLKANSSLWSTNTGTDVYGFSVLPSGYRYDTGTFFDLGKYALFWSSSECAAFGVWIRLFSDYDDNVIRMGNGKSYGLSLRCLQN